MSPWSRTVALQDSLPDSVDVVVVGGDPHAWVVARGLARSGASVAVLDNADSVGCTGISQGTGHAFVGLPESAARLVQSIGVAAARPLYELSAGGLQLLSSLGLSTSAPGLWEASDPREAVELSDSVSALNALGFASAFDGQCLVGPQDAVVEPALACRRLALAAQQAGARCRSGVGVHAWDGEVLNTSAGPIRAELVVAAGDLGSLTWHPFFAPCLLPYREHAVRVAGWRLPTVQRFQYGYFTFRAHDDAGMVRGARWATSYMEAGETEPVTVDIIQDKLDAAVRKRGGDPARATHRWAWIETTTCDNLPFVGPLPGEPRVVCCTGFGASGWGLGVGAAERVVLALTDDATTESTGLEPSRMVV